MWFISFEWLLCLVLVFWCVGAYRRLVRLRTACCSRFSELDTAFRQVLGGLSPVDAQHRAEAVSPAHQALHATAQLLDQALAAVRRQPLEADRLAALDAAWQALQVAWIAHVQVVAEHAEPSAGRWLADAHARWQQQLTLQAHAAASFNRAVAAYNHGIAQFPAVLMARLLGMAPGRCLSTVAPVHALSLKSTHS